MTHPVEHDLRHRALAQRGLKCSFVIDGLCEAVGRGAEVARGKRYRGEPAGAFDAALQRGNGKVARQRISIFGGQQHSASFGGSRHVRKISLQIGCEFRHGNCLLLRNQQR